MDGSEQAEFERLWVAHHRRVLAYAQRRCEHSVAWDVVAETFLVAWRRRVDLPREPLPWLLGIARGVLANQLRGERRRDALARAVAAQQRLETRPAAEPDHELLRALAELDDADRETLLLVGWDGLTPARAARVVGCTPAAYRVRLLRARRRLKAQLRRRESDLLLTPEPEANR